MELNRYDQVTVSMWGKGYAAVVARYGMNAFVDAAIAAVVAGLRHHGEARALFRAYDDDADPDYQLIDSVLPDRPGQEVLVQVRDAAFHIRWLQLNGLNV